jgi:hypothetical protein
MAVEIEWLGHFDRPYGEPQTGGQGTYWPFATTLQEAWEWHWLVKSWRIVGTAAASHYDETDDTIYEFEADADWSETLEIPTDSYVGPGSPWGTPTKARHMCTPPNPGGQGGWRWLISDWIEVDGSCTETITGKVTEENPEPDEPIVRTGTPYVRIVLQVLDSNDQVSVFKDGSNVWPLVFCSIDVEWRDNVDPSVHLGYFYASTIQDDLPHFNGSFAGNTLRFWLGPEIHETQSMTVSISRQFDWAD